MGRPRKEEDEKRERMHVSLPPGLKGRYQALQARTGMDLSAIIERAMLRAIDAYEADPGEILRDLPKPNA